MNKEDKKIQKHLVDEMMKVSKTNPDVMIYMEALMKKYEELQQELDKYKNIVDELEKWLKKEQLLVLKNDNKPVYKHQEVLDKLKELKGE